MVWTFEVNAETPTEPQERRFAVVLKNKMQQALIIMQVVQNVAKN